MAKRYLEFEHSFSLDSNWMQKFITELGCTLIDNKLLLFPEKIADGGGYFLRLLPEVSVLIVDMKFNKSIKFSRLPSVDEYWIIYYDLSEFAHNNILEGKSHITGVASKNTFAIVDSNAGSTYIANKDERIYFVRIFIKKSFLISLLKDKKTIAKFYSLLKKNKTYFYGQIDSRSKSILYNLKRYTIYSYNYEFILKSVIFTLIGYFTERLIIDISSSGIYEKDRIAIVKSQYFLLSNLEGAFPGIELLAKIANMSVTKYRNLYKKIYGLTPALMFRNEKLLVAKKLLESGQFKNVSDVVYALDYQKISYFSSIYFKEFGIDPIDSLQN